MAVCRELEHKNALSSALFKEYFNFDARFCLQFLDWWCNSALSASVVANFVEIDEASSMCHASPLLRK